MGGSAATSMGNLMSSLSVGNLTRTFSAGIFGGGIPSPGLNSSGTFGRSGAGVEGYNSRGHHGGYSAFAGAGSGGLSATSFTPAGGFGSGSGGFGGGNYSHSRGVYAGNSNIWIIEEMVEFPSIEDHSGGKCEPFDSCFGFSCCMKKT